MTSSGKFVCMAHHSILLSISFGWGLIVTDASLSIVCHSCRFACHQRVIKTFPGPGYLHSKYGVVWLWNRLVYFYIWLTISPCYGSIPLALVLIGTDGGLSTLCQSCRFAGQQRVLKTFPLSESLHPNDWGSLTMTTIGKFVYMAQYFILLRLNPFGLRVDRELLWFEHSMSK